MRRMDGREGGRKGRDGQKRLEERTEGLLHCEVCGVGRVGLSSSQAREGGREGEGVATGRQGMEERTVAEYSPRDFRLVADVANPILARMQNEPNVLMSFFCQSVPRTSTRLITGSGMAPTGVCAGRRAVSRRGRRRRHSSSPLAFGGLSCAPRSRS